jgi:hypothetical protein
MVRTRSVAEKRNADDGGGCCSGCGLEPELELLEALGKEAMHRNGPGLLMLLLSADSTASISFLSKI